MEIEYIDKGQDKYPENITDLMKLARKSQSGDSYSSSFIAVCILCKHKKVNSKFFRYIDLAIEQGDQSLPFFLDILFTEGYTEDGFKIEQSEELRFKYLLKRKSLSSISSVITLARNNSERQKKVIAAAKTNQLHPIYNELLCDLSELIENDDSKLFSYVDNLNSIYSFFLNNRHSLLAKPIALTEEEYMTHYTNIQAIHSMLRIPKNFSEYEEYRQKYEWQDTNIENNEESYFYGKVIESNAKYIIVEPNENEEERKAADKISVGLGENNDALYTIGTNVKITYDGTILESYPAQVKATKIEIKSAENFEILFKDRQPIDSYNKIYAILDKSETDKYNYTIYAYDGSVNIKIDDKEYSLKDALLESKITMEEIIQKANKDLDNNKITGDMYKDGGSMIYQYDTYTIIKCHTIEGNRDVYIGTKEMTLNDVK